VQRLLLALLAVAPLNAQLVVDTYAGGAIPSGVPAQNVALGYTSGLAWDPSGDVVFCDTTNNVIRRVRTDGIMETIVGTGVTGFGGDGGPATKALINSPSNPVYDGSGNLYFSDSLNVRIRRIDTNGIITSVAGDGQAPIGGLDSEGPATSRSLPYPLSFALDTSGNIYIAEPEANRIRRVTTGGNLEIFAQVSDPTGLVVDESGNVYVVSATGPGSILRITPAGTVSTFAAFTYSYIGVPNTITLVSTDAAGNVYLWFNGQFLRYAPDGTSTTVATPSGFGGGVMNAQGTWAFASTLTPYAYVGIPVIQTFTSQGVLTTIAGGNPQSAPDGTPLRDVWFRGPLSIAFSSTGDLYIAEFDACLIRKISAAGLLSTFAGTGTCGYPAPSGTAATANLVYPYSIAVDSQNNVWVADDFLNLYSISQQGALSAMIPTPVEGGKGQLAVDGKDRVYVLGDDSLYRVLSDGSYQAVILPPSRGGAPVSLSGIGADSSGNVYFSGYTPPAQGTYIVNDDATFTLKYLNFNADALAFDPSGNIWGSGEELETLNSSGISSLGSQPGSSGDGGPAQSAGMNAFGSVAFGPDGNLYFVDGDSSHSNRIRRVTGSGPSAPPLISQNGIVNAISYAGGPIALGEIISIFGSNFGASGLQVTSAVNNAIPNVIGRTKVLFAGSDSYGFPAAITAITPNQIDVFVPTELTTGTFVTVQVQVDNILSAPVTIAVAETAPGLSPSILNQDGTLNSSANPAPRGSIVSFYGTGLGPMTPQLPDGYLAISTPYSAPVSPYSMTIGSQPATIPYAGDAPTLPTGVFQINAAIPANISPGPAPVSLSIGGSSGQVTVAVK
jgi:trimeric autotransporter adhesin